MPTAHRHAGELQLRSGGDVVKRLDRRGVVRIVDRDFVPGVVIGEILQVRPTTTVVINEADWIETGLRHVDRERDVRGSLADINRSNNGSVGHARRAHFDRIAIVAVDTEPVVTGAVKLQPGEHFGRDVVRIVVGRVRSRVRNAGNRIVRMVSPRPSAIDISLEVADLNSGAVRIHVVVAIDDARIDVGAAGSWARH